MGPAPAMHVCRSHWLLGYPGCCYWLVVPIRKNQKSNQCYDSIGLTNLDWACVLLVQLRSNKCLEATCAQALLHNRSNWSPIMYTVV